MEYKFYTADVFTDRPFGGNGLAVLPNAEGLTGEQMQLIAREFNLSETSFVLPPEKEGTRKLRIFTPNSELPFAGHPTVGAAFVLAAIGELPLAGDTTRIIFEEGVGPVPVEIRARAGQPVFTQLTAARLPEVGPSPPPSEQIAAMLSLNVDDVLDNEVDEPTAISCGVPFLYVPLKSMDAVRRARLNWERFESALVNYWAQLIFLFSYQAENPDHQIHARMFAGAVGIDEDPATGSAATSLAGYLAPRSEQKTGTLRWRVEQGYEMGRPSIIDVEADLDLTGITAVRVGGSSVMMTEGTLRL